MATTRHTIYLLDKAVIRPNLTGNNFGLNIQQMQSQLRWHTFIEFQEEITGSPLIQSLGIYHAFNFFKGHSDIRDNKDEFCTQSKQRFHHILTLMIILLSILLARVFIETEDKVGFRLSVFVVVLVLVKNQLNQATHQRIRFACWVVALFHLPAFIADVIIHLHPEGEGSHHLRWLGEGWRMEH